MAETGSPGLFKRLQKPIRAALAALVGLAAIVAGFLAVQSYLAGLQPEIVFHDPPSSNSVKNLTLKQYLQLGDTSSPPGYSYTGADLGRDGIVYSMRADALNLGGKTVHALTIIQDDYGRPVEDPVLPWQNLPVTGSRQSLLLSVWIPTGASESLNIVGINVLGDRDELLQSYELGQWGVTLDCSTSTSTCSTITT